MSFQLCRRTPSSSSDRKASVSDAIHRSGRCRPNAGVGSQLFNRFLLEAAELNGIKDLPEHTSRVLDAFLVTDLRRMGFKESGAALGGRIERIDDLAESGVKS